MSKKIASHKPNGQIEKVYDDDKMKILAEEYSIKRNAREISLRENIPLQTVYHYIRKFNFQKPKRRRALNENYFADIDKEVKAYLLGFIMADGCISMTSPACLQANRLIVNISHKDRHILELLQKELECDYKIRDYMPSESTFGNEMMSSLAVNSVKLCSDLTKYGISINKTGKECFPKIKKQLKRHFIRGFLDGDGHITKHGVNGITIGFTSTSIAMLNDLKKVIAKELNIVGAAGICTYQKRNKDVFMLSYCHSKDIEQLFKYLYKDANYFFDRKFLKLTS